MLTKGILKPMEALKERSFKKMFERPAKKNFLDEVTIDNSKIAAINEIAKEKNSPDVAEIPKIHEEIVEKSDISNESFVAEMLNPENEFKEKFEKEQSLNLELGATIAKLEQIIKDSEKSKSINDNELLEKIKIIEKEKDEISSQYQARLSQLQNKFDDSQEEYRLIKEAYNNKCIEFKQLQDEMYRLEAAKIEIEHLLNNASTTVTEVEVDDEDLLIPEEVTNTLAENGRLSALNHELELQLLDEIEARDNAQMLYQELRSIMVSIGIEKNLEIFDQTKIELQQKINIIEKQEKLLNERDQYITSIQNSLMDGIGQMFLKRPTETVLALNQNQVKVDAIFQEESLEVTKKNVEVHTGKVPVDSQQGQLLISLVNKLNEIIVIKKNDEEKAIRVQEENYLQFLNENWIDIKKQAHTLKSDGWTPEDISELLDVRMPDLKKIMNRRIPKGNRSD